MLAFGGLAFLNPWLLAALAALPALWWLLRATPPAPRRFRFPGVRLLLGLEDVEKTPDRTPWWLVLLRCLIAAAAILAFAEPVLNPKARLTGDGPLLLLMDGGWASAEGWAAARERALEALGEAERADRAVAFVSLARPGPAEAPLDLRPAAEWRGEVEAATPAPWAPLRADFAARLDDLPAEVSETVWITDGLAHAEEDGLAEALAARGSLIVIEPATTARAVRAPTLEDGALGATVLRADAAGEATAALIALGTAGEGGARRYGQAEAVFANGERTARAVFDLPLELRNRVERVAIAGEESAGAVALADEGVRRRRAALVAGGTEDEARRLLADLHYLRAALRGRAETVGGSLEEALDARPDALFLADVGRFSAAERERLLEWVESGGLLVRFAGPRLAAGGSPAGGGFAEDDPLLPVPLRAGGRMVGGAMAWGEPQRIRSFSDDSPFAGLEPPDDVTVSRQILARLGPELSEATWAALADGTPLVTAVERGAGRVVLFHVTANADWSSLPLSGLYVDMVDRLLQVSGGGGGATDRAALAGRTARPIMVMDGFGRLADAAAEAGVPSERLESQPGPDAPPGLYEIGEAVLAYNLFRGDDVLTPAPPPPAGAARETLETSEERPLAPWLLGAAVALLALDTLAALFVAGRLPRLRRRAAATAAVMLAMGLATAMGPEARAQEVVDEARALRASLDTVLAYVITGDEAVDRMSEAGLTGLSARLLERTAVEPAPPIGVDLETDSIAFFPVLYWPVTASQPTPSDVATGKLNQYLRGGGMIVFDTRDRHLDVGQGSPNQEALQRLARALDLPPLEPVAPDHVLTRTFYLLESFPGRWAGGRVWVEASADPEAGAEEGRPFRNLNDGVSPVIVGSADWAAAWAVGPGGDYLAPVGTGSGGWRQREVAFRFGINLVMYALTGNYKSDQVHVPALLERIGQ